MPTHMDSKDAGWTADKKWFIGRCIEAAVEPSGVVVYEFCRKMTEMFPHPERKDAHHIQSMRNRVFRSLEWATGG